jgi:hypothetical protein
VPVTGELRDGTWRMARQKAREEVGRAIRAERYLSMGRKGESAKVSITCFK